ncbi:hypothetical protein GCM10027451_05540 [Geodermatophilus aquaeductus]
MEWVIVPPEWISVEAGATQLWITHTRPGDGRRRDGCGWSGAGGAGRAGPVDRGEGAGGSRPGWQSVPGDVAVPAGQGLPGRGSPETDVDHIGRAGKVCLTYIEEALWPSSPRAGSGRPAPAPSCAPAT